MEGETDATRHSSLRGGTAGGSGGESGAAGIGSAYGGAYAVLDAAGVPAREVVIGLDPASVSNVVADDVVATVEPVHPTAP